MDHFGIQSTSLTSPALPQLQLWMASYTERGGLLKLAASSVDARFLLAIFRLGSGLAVLQELPMDSPFLVDVPLKKCH
jgi:hypothetical protein